jgi:hypothetical protein
VSIRRRDPLQHAHGKQRRLDADAREGRRPGSASRDHVDTDERREIVAARRDLTRYLLGVVNDSRAPARRRDEMAFCLSKIIATALPKMARDAPPTAKAKDRAPAKPRVSTYVSKKKQADERSRTAQKGSKWDGLVNGSGTTPAIAGCDTDDEDDA